MERLKRKFKAAGKSWADFVSGEAAAEPTDSCDLAHANRKRLRDWGHSYYSMYSITV